MLKTTRTEGYTNNANPDKSKDKVVTTLKKLDLQEIKRIISNLDIKGIKLKDVSKRMSDSKFDVTKKYQIEYLLMARILELIFFLKSESENMSSVSDELQAEWRGHYNSVLTLLKGGYGDQFDKVILPVSSKYELELDGIMKLNIKDYFNNHNRIARNSKSAKHVGAFGVTKVSDMPNNNFVIKIKNFSSDSIHPRLGIAYNNNQIQIIEFIRLENKKE